MMPILQVGPLALPLPALIYLASIWIGLSLAEKRAPFHDLKPDDVFNIAMAALVSGIIGARLAYVARYPAAFSATPLDVFSRNPGLLDPLAGMVVGGIVAAIYIQRKKYPFPNVLDGLTPVFAIFMAGAHLADFASGAGYGKPTGLPWAIELWGAQRHPVQIYEAIAALIILAWVWRKHISPHTLRPGETFLTFFILTSASRLFFEWFRTPAYILPGGFSGYQVLAWIFLAAGLFSLQRIYNTQTQ